MALFRITIEKYLASQAEYWTNVYWAEGTTLADAATVANAIYPLERMMYLPSVIITKYRVDDGQPNTDVFTTVPLNLPGTSGLTGDAMPLFVVARFDFQAGSGRPSRKFYRGVLTELWVDAFGAISSSGMSSLTSWAQQIGDVPGYVDVDGDAIIQGSAHPRAGIRQLRRGSKKKSTP